MPVLEGTAYVGAVLRDDLPPEAGGDEAIAAYATARPPTAIASTRLSDALAELDLDGGRRLVVLADDRTTYVGILCLRSDRRQLCVDAECHAGAGAVATSSPAISADAHVADLVIADPSRARVFEKLGIDYCCGGKIPLADAAEALGLDPGDVIALLEEPRDRGSEDVDWTAEPLSALVRHILATHHAYLHEELAPLGALVAKVARAHGDAHPALHDVEATFNRLAAELTEHLAEEETAVFPACLAAEEAGDGPAIGDADRRDAARARRRRRGAPQPAHTHARLRSAGRCLQLLPSDARPPRHARGGCPPARARGEQHPRPARARAGSLTWHDSVGRQRARRLASAALGRL